MTDLHDHVKLHPKVQTEIRRWLARISYTHMATLTFNDPMMRYDRARRNLRDWDARLNRRILGPSWLKKPDERLLWTAFCEEPESNLHWHLLIEALPDQHTALHTYLEREWVRLIPSGSARLREVFDQQGAIAYVTKTIRARASYEGFCHSHEFVRARS